MEFLLLAILVYGFALGYLHQVAILQVFRQHTVWVHLSEAQLALNLVVHRIGQGADSRHRLHRYVLHRTDIEVGVGTYHRRIAAGAHCVRENHCVAVCLSALHGEHEVLHRGSAVVGDASPAGGSGSD